MDNFTRLPTHRPLLARWISVLAISLGAVCSTCASSAAAFTEIPAAREFGVSQEITTLAVALFVFGLGLGPLISGPLSDVIGRRAVYLLSFSLFFALSWPVAFAPDIAVFLVFRFLTGFCASAFLSVAGGSVSDMFTNDEISTPLAVYTIAPFLSPELGPLYSGFVNQHINWRYTFHILTIFSFVTLIFLWLFVPESYVPVLLRQKVQEIRKKTKDANYYAPGVRDGPTFRQRLWKSLTTPFLIFIYEPMALLIGIWDSLILGIIYISFQAFPIVFRDAHGFSIQFVGLTFLGIMVGILGGLASQPLWNRFYKRRQEALDATDPPPELRLIVGQVGGVCAAASLFWLTFTTYRSVHWIVPIIASVPFGTSVYFIFTSSFTYLIIAYRPVAASALAGNASMRSMFAAGCSLYANAMFARLGTVGAMALLAGLTTLMVPLPFIFYRYGARFRAKSRFATPDAKAPGPKGAEMAMPPMTM
ncbi:MFS general substrate transporter [Vararia minispora EC-137]|uniref:MFS general substrate transporter n=1 Tax=Vararia minispora EC-137 TaxID=1314806 RepID=A0ACB8QLP6_9AGAM|nr:MFS general substrate transporter [Vararia minispora EC-137]